jgi:chorismate synthase
MQNITSEEADRRRQEANNIESTEDDQSHILSGTFDGSKFNAKLATIHSTTMFPTNVIPTTTNVQPKHDATTAAEHNITSAKTRAHSPGTFAGQSK